ncbi:MAG: hypothetical protein ABIB71_06400 [Candidatus Woesearchaeota archaeon]
MVAIHLNKQIDDIFSGYSKLETPEERKEHKVEGSLFFEGFEELVRQYEEILAIGKKRAYHWSTLVEALSKISIVLDPEQINSFLQATIRYEDNKPYGEHTGLFITQLIHNSHYAGNNKFTLNTKAFSEGIGGIGYNLKGRKNKLLEIIVNGDAGKECGHHAKNIGKLHISGNVGHGCGKSARNIKELYIGSNAEHWCGCAAKNSTFKTPNKKTLRLLKIYVPKGKGNKIYFINKTGKEKKIKW